MADYTQRMQTILEQVNRRGNPNSQTIQDIFALMYEMNERINQLEDSVVLDDKPARKKAKG